MIQNFRPGVIERLGLGYEEVKALNPNLIYASVSGYGIGNTHLEHKPGQDLLAQSISGLTWLNSSREQLQHRLGWLLPILVLLTSLCRECWLCLYDGQKPGQVAASMSAFLSL